MEDFVARSSVLIERPDGLWEAAPLEPIHADPRATAELS